MKNDNKDFWDELGEERQKNIDQALKEVKEGKTTPHSEVQKKYRQWLRNRYVNKNALAWR